MSNEQIIYTEDEQGNLVKMKPSAPEDEPVLQKLIAMYPELVGGENDNLLLVTREKEVPDKDDGGNRWSLDNLYVTRSAIPVLVEVKRAVDTRLRREVVGQLLEYAANGVVYWPDGNLEASFRENLIAEDLDPDVELQNFLGGEDPAEFWNKVQVNLQAGNVRLVVLADKIPRELARIIEFLNEQMRAEVIAIELQYFESEKGQRTLVPRIIGQTERASVQKSNSKPGVVTEFEKLVLEKAANEIEEFKNPDYKGKKHIDSEKDSFGFQWVIYTQKDGVVWFEYIARDRADEQRARAKAIAAKTGLYLNEKNAKIGDHVPPNTVNESGVIDLFKKFMQKVKEAG